MRYIIPILMLLYFVSSANALVYYQDDWTSNGNCALMFDDANAPFDPNCLTALGNKYHNIHLNSTVVAPNFILTCKHWHVTKGCRIKSMGNTALYLGKDPNGVAQYTDIYIVSDYRDLSGIDFTIYRVKKAINPDDPNVPDPNKDSNYDWVNDPNGYFEDANLASYMNLYKATDELDKDTVIAGFGLQRIFGVHDLFSNNPYEYAVGSGILHWGYNQIYSASSGSISIRYDTDANNGEVPNEVGVGVLDSGTAMYLYDELDDEYKIAGTFYGGSTSGGIATFGGPRVSSFIDEIAYNVSAMGMPTFADKLLGGLKQDVTVSYEIENDANELNPVDPNFDELTITVTVDDLFEFADGGADILTITIDVPDDFGTDMFDPSSGFGLHFLNNVYYCNIDLSQINPNNSITKTLTLHVSHAAEPLSSAEILISTAIDNLTETSDTISCDIANWSDPCSEPGVVYVNDDAMVSTSGTSWAYPYKTLQDAIARAIKLNSGIDEIWIAAGTYTADEGESFSIAKDIEIYGGFVGSESDVNERSKVANKTIITVSDSLQNVFWLSTEDAQKNIVLDGLTITGSAQSGIFLRRNTCDIRHCVISGNGAGIAGNNATLSMQDCVLTYNGTALDMSFSGIAIDRSLFSFSEETGIKLNSDGFFMVNSVISENIDDGLNFATPINTEILNCDIVNNGGYGLYGISGGATTRINNNIVYGNYGDAIPTGQYINNNVQSDPPFWFPYVQDSNYVKYYLSTDSNSCIDTGNTQLVGYYPLDLYGRARVIDNVVDIGAVESVTLSECDFNLDGVVNFIDYAEFSAVWAIDSNDPNSNYDVKYDFDTDGYIGIDDLDTFASHWLDGGVFTRYVTTAYKIDFDYRVPDVGFFMMSLPLFEPESADMYLLDGTLLEATEIQETTELVASKDSILIYTDAKKFDLPVYEKLGLAKEKLSISNSLLSTEETSVPYVVPQVNLIKKQRQQNLDYIKSVPVMLELLDKFWLGGEFDKVLTEKEYLEFREAIEKSADF